jgi:hypothetical protein
MAFVSTELCVFLRRRTEGEGEAQPLLSRTV